MENNVNFQPRFDPQTGAPLYPIQRHVYTLPEVLFAWFCLLAAYGFCRVYPVWEHPLGGMLWILGLFPVTAILLKCRGGSFGLMPCLLAGSVLLTAPGLLLTSNSLFHLLIYGYALAVWCYFVSAAGGNRLERGLSDLLFLDFIKAILLLPFASLGKLFGALTAGRGKGGKVLLKILLGFVIALVPTVVIAVLLSYDAGFVELARKLFDFRWGTLFSHLGSLILAIPLGMYTYGLFFSSMEKKCAESFTAQGCRSAADRAKLLPPLTLLAAALPVLVLYAVFFASQWKYYISGFIGVLPDAEGYASYARNGFFQLCAVSVINLLLIIGMQFFGSRKNGAARPLTRILSVLFSCATLVLIATAIAKLILYIRTYGLTPKRVHAAWFMGVLAVLFLLVILKQATRKFPLIPIGTLATVVLFAGLILSGSETRIADYNVDRYLEGSLKTIDVAALEELGDPAIPAVVRLVTTLDRERGMDIHSYDFKTPSKDPVYFEAAWILNNAASREPAPFFSRTLPRLRAEKALKQAGIRYHQVTN